MHLMSPETRRELLPLEQSSTEVESWSTLSTTTWAIILELNLLFVCAFFLIFEIKRNIWIPIW